MKIVTCAVIVLVSGMCGTVLAQGTGSELKPVAFSTLDANKDGKISLTEARAAPDLEASFDMLDLNHDGFLSSAEFQMWTRALKPKDGQTHDPATTPGGSAGAQHMPAT